MSDFPAIERGISRRGFNRAMQAVHDASNPTGAGIGVDTSSGNPVFSQQPVIPIGCWARIIDYCRDAYNNPLLDGNGIAMYQWIEQDVTTDGGSNIILQDKNPATESTRGSQQIGTGVYINVLEELNNLPIDASGGDVYAWVQFSYLTVGTNGPDCTHFCSLCFQPYGDFAIIGTATGSIGDITISTADNNVTIEAYEVNTDDLLILTTNTILITKPGWYRLTLYEWVQYAGPGLTSWASVMLLNGSEVGVGLKQGMFGTGSAASGNSIASLFEVRLSDLTNPAAMNQPAGALLTFELYSQLADLTYLSVEGELTLEWIAPSKS